jgi:hypothetical protein
LFQRATDNSRYGFTMTTAFPDKAAGLWAEGRRHNSALVRSNGSLAPASPEPEPPGLREHDLALVRRGGVWLIQGWD